MKKKLITITALLLTHAAHAQTPLERAHEAYLSGQMKDMTVALRAALESAPRDAVVGENAQELLRAAYARAGRMGLPADWKLPESMQGMKVSVQRSEGDRVGFGLKLSGVTPRPGLVRQLRLTRFPDEVVLDKAAGVGAWEEGPDPADGSNFYQLASRKGPDPVPAGLYLLNVETTEGQKADGWFILESTLNASASPAIAAPAAGQAFRTPNPTFRWNNFHSPEYQPDERRSLWAGVARNEAPDYDWDELWSYYTLDPSLTELTLGVTPGGAGKATRLEPGNYVFVLNYHEFRRFGDLRIQRTESTWRPFRVE